MQVCYDGLKGISFDLGDNSKWEFVLLDNTQPGSSRDNAFKVEQDEEEDEEASNSNILDLPRSWVDALSISNEEFQARCPSGSKTVLYKNAKCVSVRCWTRDQYKYMDRRLNVF
jgi:hypothetical protein